jgi:heavy metal sensor kinase
VRTIRGRLRAWYAAAMLVTLAAFGLVIYIAGRRAAYRELEQRLASAADVAANVLIESYRAGGVVVRDDPGGRPRLAPELAATLEALPGLILIRHREGRLLFLSPAARALTAQQVEELDSVMSGPPGVAREVALQHGGPVVWTTVRRISGAGPHLGRLLAGADAGPTEAELGRLAGTIGGVLVVGIFAALVVGEWIARRAVEPVDRIITEVRMISDGRSLHRRLAASPIDDELGRLAATLNEMMARLERSFATLRRFTADASHELKTPLTVLRAGIERLVSHPGIPAEALPVIEDTLGEINRMTELVEALLTLARADEGRTALHREAVDLRAVVEEVRETAELFAEHQGLQVEVHVPEVPVVVDVDPTRWRQLILNLLENAVKYTPPGGTVWLRLEASPAIVRLAVSDTGIGIAAGDLPHLFDRFWRADTARTRMGERAGTGLGLAICKWIVEAHGGSIDATSRPGRGTTLTVVLPRRADGD